MKIVRKTKCTSLKDIEAEYLATIIAICTLVVLIILAIKEEYSDE